MLRWVLAVMGACAALGPVTASAQAETVVRAVRDDAPRPLVNPGEWIIHGDYPPQALREGLSGTTGVRLDVDEQGAPVRCTITATSGSEVLDTATCAKLMERARFYPVQNSAGFAVPSMYETSVRWAESDDASDPFATTPQPIDTRLWVSVSNLEYDPAVQGDRTAMYDLEVDGAGAVTNCTITRGSGDELFDNSLCRQLKANAAFDVSSSGAGRFSGSQTEQERILRIFPQTDSSRPDSRNYEVRAFIEEDGTVSHCRWVGRNAPALDPWPVCNRSSWVEQRDVDGKPVRGETYLGLSQRKVDELAVSRDDRDNPANRDITMVFLEDGSVSDCRWSGANPPAFDSWLACNYVADALKQNPALAAVSRGRQVIRPDENEVAALAARAARER